MEITADKSGEVVILALVRATRRSRGSSNPSHAVGRGSVAFTNAVVVQFEYAESRTEERFLAEFILSPTEGLGMTIVSDLSSRTLRQRCSG